MSKTPPKDPNSYPVGYRKPPSASRFTPGKSGNPKGRPKGARSLATILDKTFNRRVTVMENGKPKKLTILEIGFRKVAVRMAKGDVRVVKMVTDLFLTVQPVEEAAVDQQALQAEDRIVKGAGLQEFGAEAEVGCREVLFFCDRRTVG